MPVGGLAPRYNAARAPSCLEPREAKVAELVDAQDLGSCGATRESSSLSFRTSDGSALLIHAPQSRSLKKPLTKPTNARTQQNKRRMTE